MTTTRKPTNCTDCGRKLTAANRASTISDRSFEDTCIACYEYAGWENTHSDEGHDLGNFDADCPVCQEIDRTIADEPKAGHTDTAPRSWSSHAGHDHPATPKARAACRKAAQA